MTEATLARSRTATPATLPKRLRSGSRKNATRAAFREVGRVIRAVRLLRHLTGAPLRRRVTAKWRAGEGADPLRGHSSEAAGANPHMSASCLRRRNHSEPRSSGAPAS
ncbi:Tn3 family transposase [Streptosporangium canum]|uniref:Tn3 family transposase n=1 Tax=Streptosporangium canum TaxID=324952 RepID=UPI001160D8FB